MSLCKICLCNDPQNDISELKLCENVNQSGEYILLFCLGIQVIQGSEQNMKLCERCKTKLVEFHQFKSLALKNEATLSSLGLQKYIENDLKSEVLSQNGDDTAYDEPLIDYFEIEEAEPIEKLLLRKKDETPTEHKILVLEKRIEQPFEFEVSATQDLKEQLANDELLTSRKNSKKRKTKKSRKTANTCNVCRKQFKTKQNLDSHSERHKPKAERKTFECAHCSKKFTSKKFFDTHIETHKRKEERRTFDCTLCNKIFLVKKLLEIHLGTHKIEKQLKFECPICSKIFMKKKSLEIHLETHKQKEEQQQFECTLCNKMFNIKGSLDRHLKTHKVKEEKFECAHCNETFASKHVIETHFIRNHPEQLSESFISSEIFQCDLCPKNYRGRKNLVDHVRANHAGCKALCPICNKRFAEAYLQDHIRTRHQSESLRHKCDICDHKFVTQSLLKRHVSIHTGVKPFSCDICDAKFRLKYSVGLHKAQVHEKARDYVCHICSNRYFTQSMLQRHLRAHASPVDPVPTVGKRTIKREILKTVTCPDCGKPLASEDTLKHHRLLHKGLQHHCEICGLAFATRKYVRNHMKTHTQVKKFACKFCAVAFVRSGARRRHELEVHIMKGEKRPPRKDTRTNRIRKKTVKVKTDAPIPPTVEVTVPKQQGLNSPFFPILTPKIEEVVVGNE